MLGRSLRETRSENRDVKTIGGAHAHRGVLVSGGCTQVQTAGGGHVASEELNCLQGSGKLPERREGRGDAYLWLRCVLGLAGCRDGMECRSRQDGALWLSEVGSLHGRGDECGAAKQRSMHNRPLAVC